MFPIMRVCLSASACVFACLPACLPVSGQMFALLVGPAANKALYDPHMGFHVLSVHYPWTTVHGVVREPAHNPLAHLSLCHERALRVRSAIVLDVCSCLYFVRARTRRRLRRDLSRRSQRVSMTPCLVPLLSQPLAVCPGPGMGPSKADKFTGLPQTCKVCTSPF
jgi:hypothetical protein